MSQSKYSLRPRKQLDYALINAGKSLQYLEYGFSPSHRPSSSVVTAHSPLGATSGKFSELKELLDQVKEENAVLEQSHQLEQMWLELEALCARNAELEAKCTPPPAIKGDEKKPPHTLQDLRSKTSLTDRVDKFLATLEDSSTDEDNVEKDNTCTSRGRRHTLKSGKDSKLTSRVLAPQLWPHSHLSLMYVSKDKKYNDLSLAEFAAGYAAILQRPTLSSSELRAHIDHLSVLMYLATQYSWPSVRDLHSAILYEIKCGRASWGDSFTYLESCSVAVFSPGTYTLR